MTPFSDIENENVDSCNDEVYYLTVKFEKTMMLGIKKSNTAYNIGE